MMGKLSHNNAFVMKCILRYFEMVSVLKVNFHKSCVMGIKDIANLTSQVASSLNCKVGEVPFKFLGIIVGANPRKESTWNTVIHTIKSRLSGWRNRFLSFGGLIVLINAVLSSLPMYYLCCYKAPKKVIQSLSQIQFRFLWGVVRIPGKSLGLVGI